MRLYTNVKEMDLIAYQDKYQISWWTLRLSKDFRMTGAFAESLKKKEFSEVREGLWCIPAGNFSAAKFKEMFPNGYIIREEEPLSLTVSEKTSMDSIIPLGNNILGEMVFSHNGIRFAIDKKNKLTLQNENDRPSRFLFATDRKNLIESLYPLGFLIHNKKESISKKEFDEFLENIKVESFNFGNREAQEAFEAMLNRFVIGRMFRKDWSPIKDSIGMYERIPTANWTDSTQKELQQYSTPIPLSFAAQLVVSDILRSASDDNRLRIYEPTAGHGGLLQAIVSMANNNPERFQIFMNEIDPKRLERLQAVFSDMPAEISLSNFDATSNEVPKNLDIVIGNPPFGNMDFCSYEVKREAKKHNIEKLDHWIVWRALHGLREGGTGVFLIGADSHIKPGEIRKEGRTFLEELTKSGFRIQGLVDIKGQLYNKNGASWPIRMLVVERGAPGADFSEQMQNIPSKLPVLEDWQAVFSAANTMRNNNPAWMKYLAEIRQKEDKLKKEKEIENRRKIRQRNSEEIVEDGLDDALEELVQGNQQTILEESQEVVAQTTEAENPITSPIIEEAEKEDEEERKENILQVPYRPASKLGQPEAMIPKAMEGYVLDALDNLQERLSTRGHDVDSYVAQELGWTKEELEERLSPEQIDAVAFSFIAQEDGRALLVGDATGIGKGRTLAANIARKISKDETVIFVTERPNLFTDICRDLKDIDALDLVSPLIVNQISSATILNENGQPIFKPNKKEFEECLKTQSFGKANLIFMTYSQLASGGAEKRLNWLEESISRKASEGERVLLVMDEAHNAAGESATNRRFMKLLENPNVDVVYASATSMKSAKNIPLYLKTLPPYFSEDSIKDVVARHKNAAMECIATGLARDGKMVRREHNNSNMEMFITPISEEKREMAFAQVDTFAKIMEAFGYVSGEVNKVVDSTNAALKEFLSKIEGTESQKKRFGASSQNFGSQLFQIARQFYMSLCAEQTADTAIEALRNGQKPIIIVDQTMESAMRWAAGNTEYKEIGLDSEDGGQEDFTLELSGQENEKPELGIKVGNSFKIALKRLSKKITQYTIRDSEQSDPEIRELMNDDIRKTMEMVDSLIDELSDDLPLSVIDYLDQRFKKEGFEMAEITKRTLRIDEEGYLHTRKPLGANEEARDFNNGKKDAILFNVAGATGISLHASRKFADQRERCIIELQGPQNPNTLMQAVGRGNRKGQVVNPVMHTIIAGTPAESRAISNRNNKVRGVSSAASGNRDNRLLNKETVDILNVVGNEACFDWARENIDIVIRLGLQDIAETIRETDNYDDLPENLTGEKLVSRITGRSHMLKISQQELLWSSLESRFRQKLEELDAIGQNPLENKLVEWINPRIAKTEILLPGIDDNSIFGGPVFFDDIRYDDIRDPVPFEKAVSSIIEMSERESALLEKNIEFLQKRFEAELEHIAEPFIRFLEKKTGFQATKEKPRMLSGREILLKIQNKDLKEFNLSKEEEEKAETVYERALARKKNLETMAKIAKSALPGTVFSLENENGGIEYGIIAHSSIPEKNVQNSGEWKYSIFFAGDSKRSNISMNQLMLRGKINFNVHRNFVENQFDSAPKGVFEGKAVLLHGNLLSAMVNYGGESVIYRDPETGNRRTGLFLPRYVTLESLLEKDFVVQDHNRMRTYIDEILKNNHGRFYQASISNALSDKNAEKKCVIIYGNKEKFTVSVPGKKNEFGKIFLNNELKQLSEKKEFEGKRGSSMRADFSMQHLTRVLEILHKNGIDFFIQGKQRPLIEDKLYEKKEEVVHEKEALSLAS